MYCWTIGVVQQCVLLDYRCCTEVCIAGYSCILFKQTTLYAAKTNSVMHVGVGVVTCPQCVTTVCSMELVVVVVVVVVFVI